MSQELELERLKLDRYKAQIDSDRLNLERAQSAFGRQKLLFNAVMAFASLSIKSLLVFNGLSALSLLALLAVTYPSFAQNAGLIEAIRVFGYGSLSAIITVCFSYLAQVVFSEAQSEKTARFWGGGFRLAAILAALWSVWCVYDGVSHTSYAFGMGLGADIKPSTPISITGLLAAFAPYAWPITIVVLVLIFQGRLNELFARVTRLSTNGVDFSPPQQERTKASEEADKLGASPQPQDPSLLPWLTKLNAEIQENSYTGENLINLLKIALAKNIRAATFERVSRTIFGTQILAMRRILSNGKLSITDLEKIHSEHVERAGDAKADYVAWVGFLESNDLIRYEDDKFMLTPEGRLYMEFAKANGINESRWG